MEMKLRGVEAVKSLELADWRWSTSVDGASSLQKDSEVGGPGLAWLAVAFSHKCLLARKFLGAHSCQCAPSHPAARAKIEKMAHRPLAELSSYGASVQM